MAGAALCNVRLNAGLEPDAVLTITGTVAV